MRKGELTTVRKVVGSYFIGYFSIEHTVFRIRDVYPEAKCMMKEI